MEVQVEHMFSNLGDFATRRVHVADADVARRKHT